MPPKRYDTQAEQMKQLAYRDAWFCLRFGLPKALWTPYGLSADDQREVWKLAQKDFRKSKRMGVI